MPKEKIKKFEKTLDKSKRIWYNKTIEKRKSHLKVQKKIKKLKKDLTSRTECDIIKMSKGTGTPLINKKGGDQRQRRKGKKGKYYD